MDGLILGLFLLAAFFGGFASGLAGFGVAIVVSSITLHILAPMQSAMLLACFVIITQGYAIWKLRRALSWRRVAPYLAGGVIGAPLGTLLLIGSDPGVVRSGVGLLLVAYGAYGLAQPAFKPIQVRMPVDVGAGAVNGLVGGLTGLPGIIITIWAQLRGFPKDVQRTVTQPVNFAASAIAAAGLGVAGVVDAELVRLFLLGLPALAAGLWLGFRLYGKMDDAAFRKVLLTFVLLSGLVLVVPKPVFS
jgi:uncharacterized membrane protein YfcA